MTPSEQILAINRELIAHHERYDVCWKQDVLPGLGEAGIRVLHYVELAAEGTRGSLNSTFSVRSFPC